MSNSSTRAIHTGQLPNELSTLDANQLEQLAARVYNLIYLYHNVLLVGARGAGGDGGVDLRMLNENNGVEIVQCKQWSKKVDRTTLIEFYKTMRHQNAVRGHVWAPGGFSGPAIEYASTHNIELCDSEVILQLARRAGPTVWSGLPQTPPAPIPPPPVIVSQAASRPRFKWWQIALLIPLTLAVCFVGFVVLGLWIGATR